MRPTSPPVHLSAALSLTARPSPCADTIPVIGGHSGVTIVPLLSQSVPALPADVFEDKAKLAELVKRIQFGGDGASCSSAVFGALEVSDESPFPLVPQRSSRPRTARDPRRSRWPTVRVIRNVARSGRLTAKETDPPPTPDSASLVDRSRRQVRDARPPRRRRRRDGPRLALVRLAVGRRRGRQGRRRRGRQGPRVLLGQGRARRACPSRPLPLSVGLLAEPVRFAPLQAAGITKILPIGSLSAEEKDLLAACVPELEGSIAKVRPRPLHPLQAHQDGLALTIASPPSPSRSHRASRSSRTPTPSSRLGPCRPLSLFIPGLLSTPRGSPHYLCIPPLPSCRHQPLLSRMNDCHARPAGPRERAKENLRFVQLPPSPSTPPAFLSSPPSPGARTQRLSTRRSQCSSWCSPGRHPARSPARAAGGCRPTACAAGTASRGARTARARSRAHSRGACRTAVGGERGGHEGVRRACKGSAGREEGKRRDGREGQRTRRSPWRPRRSWSPRRQGQSGRLWQGGGHEG